jgi:hypothetical protein
MGPNKINSFEEFESYILSTVDKKSQSDLFYNLLDKNNLEYVSSFLSDRMIKNISYIPIFWLVDSRLFFEFPNIPQRIERFVDIVDNSYKCGLVDLVSFNHVLSSYFSEWVDSYNWYGFFVDGLLKISKRFLLPVSINGSFCVNGYRNSLPYRLFSNKIPDKEKCVRVLYHLANIKYTKNNFGMSSKELCTLI